MWLASKCNAPRRCTAVGAAVSLLTLDIYENQIKKSEEETVDDDTTTMTTTATTTTAAAGDDESVLTATSSLSSPSSTTSSTPYKRGPEEPSRSIFSMLRWPDDSPARANKASSGPRSIIDRLWPIHVDNAACDVAVMTSPVDSTYGREVPPSSHLSRRRTIRRIEETSTHESLHSKYSVNWSAPLGEGAFGAVYMATDRVTGEKFALKKISKEYTCDQGFQREMDALMHVRNNGGHPNICGLRENFDEGNYYYLILDLVQGGEMFDHLVRLGAYSEADAARLVREVASALSFLHGTGIVHGDLKPENLMLSTENPTDAVIKVVDFGCADVVAEDSLLQNLTLLDGQKNKFHAPGANTPAYCPPEALQKSSESSPRDASFDMWSLGVIIYIMLTGLHPFDLHGQASDEEIEYRIRSKKPPPLENSPVTAHLSASAIDLIKKLMARNPEERLSAIEMLQHPWVRGETARREKMADSDKKLSMFRVFKSRLEVKVFQDMVSWSDKSVADDVAKKTSLIERSFRAFDSQNKGFITPTDLRYLSKGSRGTSGDNDQDSEKAPLSLSGFEDLLSDNMKNKYFPKGHVVYREGDIGNHMYFINSGTIEVTTSDGSCARRSQGDFFGEGALLNPKKTRSASIKCVTPIHAIEISREYFEKYLANAESGLFLNLREKDKTRKRNRAKAILRLQQNLKPMVLKRGEYLYKEGEKGDALYILEEGGLDVTCGNKTVFQPKPGDFCGEHALLMAKPRNTSAVCTSDTCKVFKMKERDFFFLLDAAPHLKESLREICLRREFQKALVVKTKKSFPSVADLKEAYDSACDAANGTITLDNLRDMLHKLDPSMSDIEIEGVLKSLDLTDTGVVSFDEFKQVFGMDDAKAASI